MLKHGVQETTLTSGTGPLTLTKALTYSRFSERFSVGDLADYEIKAANGDREWGIGTVGAGNTLARTTITGTLVAGIYTPGGTALNLSTAGAVVSCDMHEGSADAGAAAQVAAEATARIAADTSEANARISADNAEASARATAVTNEATARANADALLIPLAQKGAASGVAELDAASKILASRVPILNSANVVTAGLGGQYSTIQAAINSFTNNLPAFLSTGTVNVTNGSTAITFSVAPTGANRIYAGSDLIVFAASGRYYSINKGPSAANGATFTLDEVYQGATNATESFVVYRPNPCTVYVMPGIYAATTDVSIFVTKPFVSVVGVDKNAVVIQRWVGGPNTPVVALAHGSSVEKMTIQAPDSLFSTYRMGLTALSAVSQTETMINSRWRFVNCNIWQQDPDSLDSGGDMYLDTQYFNGDELRFDNCDFIHSWDAFTPSTNGAGRLSLKLYNPIIVKQPLPQSNINNATGAGFLRLGSTGSANIDAFFFNPSYDQKTFCAGEIPNSAFSGLGGQYGFVFVDGGCTATIINPFIRMDVSGCKSKFAGAVMAGGYNAPYGTVTLEGGDISVLGAGTGAYYGALMQEANGTLNIVGKGKYSNAGGASNQPAYDNSQAIAYAAAITPNCAAGEGIVVGALTGNLTVNAPLNPRNGQRITFNYTSDATGSRQITYNAIFKSSVVPVSTVSGKATHCFQFDGANWVQVGGALVWL